jgi:outer membrane protein OmpA-like peptidoglycan-associated protein
MKNRVMTLTLIIVCGALVFGGCVTGSKTRLQTNDQPVVAEEATASSKVETSERPGAYMDQQEAAFKDNLGHTGVRITRKGKNILLNMPGNLTFTSGSHEIKPEFHSVLNSVAFVLNEFEKTRINIAGHTDSVGKASYNQALSEKRAESVATFLAQQGVHPERVIVKGYGESQPIASNKSKGGRAQNRRVEIEISPLP